jgi:serine/threonine protein kinase
MRASAKIEHPNTIRVYDFGETDGRLFLAMEYLEDRTLREVLGADGPLQAMTVPAAGRSRPTLTATDRHYLGGGTKRLRSVHRTNDRGPFAILASTP